MSTPSKIGDRVYLKNCIAGEPGCILAFRSARAEVEWPDMPEVGVTKHKVEDLVMAESHTVAQLGLDLKPAAA